MQMAAQLNPDHQNKKRVDRFKIHAASNCSSGSGVLIFGCCALIAAGIGAAFAARRARNEQRKSDREHRIDRVEDGMEGFEAEQNLKESEIPRVEGFDQEEKIVSHEEETELSSDVEGEKGKERSEELPLDRVEYSTANLEVEGFIQEEEITSVKLDEDETESSSEAEGEKGEEGSEGNLEMGPSLEVEVFDQEENRQIKLRVRESESSLDIEGDKGEEGSEGTGESSVESSTEQVWPEEMKHTEPETPDRILDIAQVGDDDASIEECLQTPHIYHMQGDYSGNEVEPMVSEEVIEPITEEEEETLKRTGIPVTELRVKEQEEIYPEEENQVHSIQSSRAFADCIQQEQVLADDLEGVKEMVVESLASRKTVKNSEDTDTDTTENELDTNVKDAGSLPQELGSYRFDRSSKILTDDLENANIEEDEKISIKSAEHEREVPVKEEDSRGEEGSKPNNDAVHPSELMNVSMSVNDKSAVALAETEYHGKTSAALDKFLHYTNPGQGEFSVGSSAEIQAIETLVTQSISKNSELVKELEAKMDNDDCVAKEFSTIGVISYMFQDQEKPEVIQESSEQFQDSSMESSAEEVYPEKEELSSIKWKEVEQVDMPKNTDNMVDVPKNTDNMVDVPKSTDDTVGVEQVKEEHGVIQETSMESSAEKESSSIDLKDNEEVDASKRTDDMFSVEQVEGDAAEDADVVQESSTELSTEEIFPYHDKELPSIDFKNIEQVEAVKRTDDVVGIEQAEEEHEECKQVASEVVDDSSSEIQAIETLVTQSISKNSELVKELGAKMDNDDCVAKEFSTISVISYMFQDQEKPEVIQESSEQFQDSSMESSAEEVYPEKEELSSIKWKEVEQVDVPKSTDNMVDVPKSTDDTVGIEQVKEEHGVIQETSMESSAEKESSSIDLKDNEEVDASKMTDDMVSVEQVEGDAAEGADVVQESSTESSTEESFPYHNKELPSIDFKNIEQVEAVKRTDDVVDIEQAKEEHAECKQKAASEVADDSSSEIQAIETLVTQSISKNSEMIKELGAKMENDDRVAKEFSTIGIVSYMFQDQENPEVIQESLEQSQAEESELFTEVGRSEEGSEVNQDSAMESSAEETFPEKEKEESPSIEPKKVDQVEVPKSTEDTVGIERVKEEHGAVQETSMGSSTEKETSSIEQNIEQVEAAKRTDDKIGIEQAGDKAEDADVIQDSSTESSSEEIFSDQDKELPSIDFKNIKQVEAVKRTNDAVGIEQAEEEHEECEQKVATKIDFLLLSSNYRVFILLLLALGLALGILIFAQPDSFRHRDHRLPEMYQKLYQLFFRSYRAVVDI